jgi:aerobic-type carbon monoxide dehydrogenase small subunit (CoxS/CutS family)
VTARIRDYSLRIARRELATRPGTTARPQCPAMTRLEGDMASTSKFKVTGLTHGVSSCVPPVAVVGGTSITTLERLPALSAAQRRTSAAAPAWHPSQQAWVTVQGSHCGYCQNGMMAHAADLPATAKNLSKDQLRTAMHGHLCRCGTYPRILTATQQAAVVMAKAGA